MELQDKLEMLNLSDRSERFIKYINLDNVERMVNMYISMLVENNDKHYLVSEIENDNPYSEISTYLTHLIEIGGLLVMNLNKFDEIFDKEAIHGTSTVAIVINCCLATVLYNHGLINEDKIMYYRNDALLEIAQRLANHYNRGKQSPIGIENYTNQLAISNLLKF